MALATQRDPGFTEAVFGPNLLRILCAVAQDNGVPVSRLCRGTGLEPADLANAAVHVSYRQTLLVVRHVQRLLPGRPLGLMMAERTPLTSYGVWGLAAMTCPTVRDALQIAINHHRSTGGIVDARLVLGDKEFGYVLRDRFPDARTSQLVMEATVACLLRFLRDLAGDGFVPRAVELDFSAPGDLAAYENFFRCPLTFGAPVTRLVADNRWLDMALPSSDPLVEHQASALLQCVEREQRRQPDVAEAIGAVLRKSPQDAISEARMAARLNISTRTLRRHLADHGLTFRAVCDEVRKDIAIGLLADAATTEEAVASGVGFSDARNFRRAFKRWTGQLPSAFRSRR